MAEKPDPIAWEPIKIKLGDLIPNPKNPKYSTKENTARLNDSLDTLGEFEDMLVNADGKSALDGHQRLTAWIEHKGADFVVTAKKSSRQLDEDEIKKLILYTGKGTHGAFDMEMLVDNFEMDSLVDFGGFDKTELENIGDSEKDELFGGADEEVAEPKAPTVTTEGMALFSMIMPVEDRDAVVKAVNNEKLNAACEGPQALLSIVLRGVS